MLSVPEALHAFGPSALVVRVVQALAAALELPGPSSYPTVDAVVDELVPVARRSAVRGGALTAALASRSASILAVANAVDAADREIVRHLGPDAYLAEPQADDAALKAVAIAGQFRHAFDGDALSVVRRVWQLPSGPLLVAVWAAVDVALPLGATDLRTLLAERELAQSRRLDAMAPSPGIEARRAVLEQLLPTLQREVDRSAARVAEIIAALSSFVPGVLPGTPGAAQTIAVKMDRLPIYKWLGARLAAERAVVEASG